MSDAKIFPFERQNRLWNFVSYQHRDQVRKYTGEPYSNHLMDVAQLLIKYIKGIEQTLLIEMALCHDLFEDTACNRAVLYEAMTEQLGYSYGEAVEVAEGVSGLTDEFTPENYPNMNRRKRKIYEAERLGQASYEVQTVKYADLISNTSSIVKYDPGFARIYLLEKYDVLSTAVGGHPVLRTLCAWYLWNGIQKLGLEDEVIIKHG